MLLVVHNRISNPGSNSAKDSALKLLMWGLACRSADCHLVDDVPKAVDEEQIEAYSRAVLSLVLNKVGLAHSQPGS